MGRFYWRGRLLTRRTIQEPEVAAMVHESNEHQGSRSVREKMPWLRFNQSLFIVSIASLPYLFYASMVGILVVLGRLIRTDRSPRLDGVTQSCIGAIALLLILSATHAYNPGEARLQLAHFLPYLLLFAYLPGLLRSLETLENLAIALVLATVPINVVAIVEFILKAPFLPKAVQSLPWIEALRKAPHKGRAMVMFDHPNVMASYLVMVLGLALGLLLVQLNYGAAQRQTVTRQRAVTDDPSISRSSSSPSTEPDGFAPGFSPSFLLLWAIGLMLIGLFCTGSRNGLAIALSQLVMFGIAARSHRRMGVAIALTIGAMAIAVLSIGLGKRNISIFNLSDDPRLGVWTIALDLMRERPWLGWGLGNFKLLYPPRLIDPDYKDIFHPHNIWLLLGTEGGIPVMILTSVMVGFICYRVVRYGFSMAGRSGHDSSGRTSESDASGRAIALGYLLAFWGCLGFALFDVTFYDVRINALNWTVLAALYTLPYILQKPDLSLKDCQET